MNICLLNRLFFQAQGGVENYTLRMARAFVDRGHTVHIVAAEGPEKFRTGDLGDGIHVHKIKVRLPNFKGFWAINRFVPLLNWYFHQDVKRFLRVFIKMHKIDVLETPEFEGYFPVFQKDFPVVVRQHGFHGMETKFSRKTYFKKPSQYILRKWIQLFCNKADVMTSVTQDFADQFKKMFGTHNKNLKILFTGIAESVFYPPDLSVNNEKTVVFVGRLEKSKGIESVIGAIPRVVEAVPDVKFTLIGKGKPIQGKTQTYSEYIAENLSQYNITLIDALPQPEIAEYYRKSTVSTFPSLFEPGGTVIMEAAMCASPSVATDIGCFAEYFEHRKGALLVPPGNTKKLAEAIIELLKDDQLRQAIRRHALEKARKDFTLTKVVDKTLAVYQRAIENFHHE